MKILVVEDDKKVADVLNQGLSESGYEIELAFDGAKALNLIQTIDYDMYILDVNLNALSQIA